MAAWLIPAIGAAVGLFGAKKQSDASKKQASQAEEEFLFNKQITNDYLLPQLQMGLDQMKANKPLEDTSRTMLSGMLSGNYDNLPSWLKPADTRGVESALSTLSDIGLEKAGQDEANKMARFNASRGVFASAEKSKNLPGFTRWFQQAASEEQANKALAMDSINRQNRQEMIGNFGVLGNFARGFQVNPAPIAQSVIGNAGQNAALRLGQSQASDEKSQGYLSDVFGFLGNVQGQKQWDKVLEALNKDKNK
jgi:hypothetical protein